MLPTNTNILTYIFAKPVGEFENFPNFVSVASDSPISFGISCATNNGLSPFVQFTVSGNIMGSSELKIRMGQSAVANLIGRVLEIDTNDAESNIINNVFMSRSKIIRLHEKLLDYKYTIDKSKNIAAYQQTSILLFALDLYNFERKLIKFLEIDASGELLVY